MNESSIFIVQKKGNRYEFPSLPTDLYIDTSFWNEMYGSGNITYRFDCTEFITDCVKNGTTLYSSSIVHEELTHIIRNSMIKETAKDMAINIPRRNDNSIDMKKLYDKLMFQDKAIAQKIEAEIKRIRGIVENTTEFLDHTEDQEFLDDLDKLTSMTEYRINTADVKHVIISRTYGINSIATKDGDFWLLDNANIYVPPVPYYHTLMLGRKNTYLKFDENSVL